MQQSIANKYGLNDTEASLFQRYARQIVLDDIESLKNYGIKNYQRFFNSLAAQEWNTDAFTGLFTEIIILEYWISYQENESELTILAKNRLETLTKAFTDMAVNLKPLLQKIESGEFTLEIVASHKKSKGNLYLKIASHWLKFLGVLSLFMTVLLSIVLTVKHHEFPNLIIVLLLTVGLSLLSTVGLIVTEFMDKRRIGKVIGIETLRVYEDEYLLNLSLLASSNPKQVLEHEYQAVFR